MRKFSLVLLIFIMVSAMAVPSVIADQSDYEWEDNGDGTATITEYVGTSKDVVIPDTLGGLEVVVIGDSAFESKQLTSVIIPEGVAILEAKAFAWNDLTSVVIPDSVISIGNSAFRENNLTSVNIPDNITTIEVSSFMYNELTSIKIPDGVTSIGNHAFGKNKLTTVEVPESVTNIGTYVFHDNNLESIVIHNDITTIGYYALNDNQENPEDLIIYGKDPSSAKDHAEKYGHTFVLLTEDSGDRPLDVEVGIESGDLFFDVPIITFPQVEIGTQSGSKVTTTVRVSDSRATGLGWSISLSATDFVSEPISDPTGEGNIVVSFPSSYVDYSVGESVSFSGQSAERISGNSGSLSDSSNLLISTDPGYGMGVYDIPVTFNLTLPNTVTVEEVTDSSSNFLVGQDLGLMESTYTSEWTFTTSSGI